MAHDGSMKIGDLAHTTGVEIETLRFYEREGLLPAPERSEGNFRLYREEDVRRVSFIRHCRNLDIALEEIRVLLRFKDSPAENCQGVNVLLDEHIGHVAERIRELRQLDRYLRKLRAQCTQAQDAAHCGILAELAQGSRDDEGSRRRGATHHVAGAHAARARAKGKGRSRA